MLTFYSIVWPGVPLNSSSCCFAHATQCLLTNDPNYETQQPPLTPIQHLCIFLRVGTIMLFVAFKPSTRKVGGWGVKVFHRESTTHTHTWYLQEYSWRAISCKDYGSLQTPHAGR